MKVMCCKCGDRIELPEPLERWLKLRAVYNCMACGYQNWVKRAIDKYEFWEKHR